MPSFTGQFRLAPGSIPGRCIFAVAQVVVSVAIVVVLSEEFGFFAKNARTSRVGGAQSAPTAPLCVGRGGHPSVWNRRVHFGDTGFETLQYILRRSNARATHTLSSGPTKLEIVVMQRETETESVPYA